MELELATHDTPFAVVQVFAARPVCVGVTVSRLVFEGAGAVVVKLIYHSPISITAPDAA
jgi:hypothetical protein